MIVPNMGTKRYPDKAPPQPTGLGDALFSTTQQRVLGLLFGQPDRSLYARELISLAGGGSGAIHRELVRLENSGLIIAERRGVQKHYKANPQSPLFDELCSIARKTVGLAEPLREALKPVASKIRAAFVYGSVAKRADTARSDIDLMIISDHVDFATVIEAIYPLQER
ncbi:MAG: transcriptional regulator, partial [Nevskiales bacterium]